MGGWDGKQRVTRLLLRRLLLLLPRVEDGA